MALARTFMAVDVAFARKVRFYNNMSGSANLSEGDGFSMVNGTVTALADSNTAGIFGIACADVTNATYGECWITGTFKVAAASSQNFAQGEAVYCASASTVDKGSASDVPIGHVVHENPASGAASVYIEICSQALDRTAHA